jgi:hypothetical protein
MSIHKIEISKTFVKSVGCCFIISVIEFQSQPEIQCLNNKQLYFK